MISVIIPTHNDERRLVPTLAALVPGAADGLIAEAVVADAGSTDGTHAVADIAGCRLVTGPEDRGARLAAAAAGARAPWLLFVAPGLVPAEGWVREVRGFLEATARHGGAERAAVFPAVPEGFGAGPRLRAAGMRLALRLGFGAAPAQGLLVGAERYRALGGHPSGRDPERRLTRRIGARRLVVLRAPATWLDP